MNSPDEVIRQHLAEAAKRDPRYLAFIGKPIETPRLLRSFPLARQCRHNLGENGVTKPGCGSCKTFGCEIKGTVKISDCANCPDWKKPHHENPALTVDFSWSPIRFDHTNLSPSTIGVRFNPSIIESGDGYLFTFRNGWAGSNIYAVQLDQQFKPISDATLLDLNQNGCGYGREDPRLFRLNGKLHISYTGVVGRYGPTNVLFARINEETLAVEDNFHPTGYQRQSWEKNHSYFDYQGTAHAVYSVSPHKILRVEGSKGQLVHETPFTGTWSGGHMRGGAAPVLHNGEWYSFFHGKWEHGRHRYNIGCYTFSPEPPFKVLRYTPHPIDIADTERKHDSRCDVIFPCGAVKLADRWAIAMGVHDRWSEIRFYDAELVESQLVTH